MHQTNWFQLVAFLVGWSLITLGLGIETWKASREKAQGTQNDDV